MKELILGILLMTQGGFDFKYKEIPLWISALGGLIGIGICIAEERDWTSILIACIPGLLCLLFSRLTKEVIGYGDGILLLVMGIYLPLEKLLSIVMLAFCIAGIVALALLVFFQKRGKEEIPFIPFLSIAYVMGYLITLGEMRL